jgi:hypothetical protein
MARCPAGHESQTNDYCDTCGAVMGGSAVTPAQVLESTALLGADPGAAGSGANGSCPNCGAERGGRFCEECGFDYELAELLPSVPAAGATQAETGPELNGHAPASAVATATDPAPVAEAQGALSVVVTADREYYTAQVERGDIIESEFPFPKYPGERRFALDADVIRIGRASASRGIAVEIDLTGPPLVPAV